MKHIFIIAAFIVTAFSTKAQDIAGSWQGTINAGGANLRFVIHVIKNGTVYSSTFDSPDQKAFGIQASKTTVAKDSLLTEIALMKAAYSGKWDGHDAITGNFKQGAMLVPLNLKRMSAEEKASAAPPVASPKPQTPKAPFPYNVETLTYDNADGTVHYGATLTRPSDDGDFPAVIIITGSGSQDRDGTLGGHKTYAVLADHLTRNGIAVLRVDDRGVGSTTPGNNFDKLTSEDFAKDVEAGLAYLKKRDEVNKNQIGLIGHSEGGMIAPMIAARRNDIAFIVLLAGPGVSGEEIWDLQMERSLIKPGLNEADHEKAAQLIRSSFAPFKKTTNYNAMKLGITAAYTNWKATVPDSLETRLMTVTGDKPYMEWADLMNKAHGLYWINYFFNYQPAINLQKVKCPVLAMNGENDTQVRSKANLSAIEAALQKGGNKHFTIKPMPKLNHMFQTTNTPFDDYETLEETFSPVALLEISEWIHANIKY